MASVARRERSESAAVTRTVGSIKSFEQLVKGIRAILRYAFGDRNNFGPPWVFSGILSRNRKMSFEAAGASTTISSRPNYTSKGVLQPYRSRMLSVLQRPRTRFRSANWQPSSPSSSGCCGGARTSPSPHTFIQSCDGKRKCDESLFWSVDSFSDGAGHNVWRRRGC